MVSSAVLGAAAGTGLALLLAVTIVMYRYYLLRKRGKVGAHPVLQSFRCWLFAFLTGMGWTGSLGGDTHYEEIALEGRLQLTRWGLSQAARGDNA